jgi:hypothetical protein
VLLFPLPGEAQLVVRPVLLRLLGVFAAAPRRATHVVLLTDAAGMQRPQFEELPLQLAMRR